MHAEVRVVAGHDHAMHVGGEDLAEGNQASAAGEFLRRPKDGGVLGYAHVLGDTGLGLEPWCSVLDVLVEGALQVVEDYAGGAVTGGENVLRRTLP